MKTRKKTRYFLIFYTATGFHVDESHFRTKDESITGNILISSTKGFPSMVDIAKAIRGNNRQMTVFDSAMTGLYEFKSKEDYEDYVKTDQN